MDRYDISNEWSVEYLEQLTLKTTVALV